MIFEAFDGDIRSKFEGRVSVREGEKSKMRKEMKK